MLVLIRTNAIPGDPVHYAMHTRPRGDHKQPPFFFKSGDATPLLVMRRTVTQLRGLLSSERSNQRIHVFRLHMQTPFSPVPCCGTKIISFQK
jgi:hypothetical protein